MYIGMILLRLPMNMQKIADKLMMKVTDFSRILILMDVSILIGVL